MIVKYEKNQGDWVNAGDTIVVLEAMKMENAISAHTDGIVAETGFSDGDAVKKGDVLCVVQ